MAVGVGVRLHTATDAETVLKSQEPTGGDRHRLEVNMHKGTGDEHASNRHVQPSHRPL